jgi:hypothetical protein
MLKMIALVVALVCTMLVAMPARAAAAGSTLRLEARAQTSGLKYTARYEEETPRMRQRFKVEIENVQPGSKHSFFHNGKMLGSITANSFGRGEVTLHVNWNGSNVPSLPRMKAGDVVRVDNLSATLAVR